MEANLSSTRSSMIRLSPLHARVALSSPLAQHLHLVDNEANFVLGAASRHGREGGDVLEREPLHVILSHFEFVPEPDAGIVRE